MKWIMAQYGTIIRVGAVREFRKVFEKDIRSYTIEASLGDDDRTALFRAEDLDLANMLYMRLVRLLEEADTNQVFNIRAEMDAFEEEKEVLKLGIKIEELDLSVRAYNCIKRGGIDTIDELIAKTTDELLELRNLGRRSRDEIVDRIHSLGLHFKNEQPVKLEFD